MLTQAQIDAGTARLTAGKLTAKDIDQMVSAFRLFFADLETVYGYAWRTKLEALDDNADTALTAAQVAGCVEILQGLGFGVAAVSGGRDGIQFKEKDEYWQYVAFVHTKFYALPSEFSNYNLARRGKAVTSSTVFSTRVEPRSMSIRSERSSRRRGY